MTNSKNYVLISPCRNESVYMKKTLDSIIAQTIKPVQWIIVDDGSTDDTPEILEQYAGAHDFIKIVRRENRGHRSVGPGVIEAFYAGFNNISTSNYDFLCKLDLDLELPLCYFEILLNKFRENPRIGTCSGKPYFLDKKNKLTSEKCGDENSVGMAKLYRVNCFNQIGGFVRQVMWDAIDGHKCRMHGWIACSWDEPDLRFIHLRPMGSSDKSMLTGRLRHGFGQYFMGTSFLYMTVSAFYRMTRPPVIFGGLAMWIGYIQCYFKGTERFENINFRKFLRTYQYQCLLKGKKRATRLLNDKQACFWSSDSLSSSVSLEKL